MANENPDAHKDIRAAFEKHGYIDYFYAGIDMMGSRCSGFRVGAGGKHEEMNNVRRDSIIGLVERNKVELSLPGWVGENPNNEMSAGGMEDPL